MIDNLQETVQNKSDGELLKMVYELDQWSPQMLESVERELSKRNILPDDVNERKRHLIETEEAELSKGKEASLIGQVIGWITVFGLLGILIGYNYAFSKMRSKYSDKVWFKYNETSRKNGSYLFYTSLLVSGLAILYKILAASGTNI